MRIYKDDVSLREFEAWSGGLDTQERIINAGKDKEFEQLIDELYPDGLDETTLNDILWFEDSWIFETLGIKDDDEDDEDF